MQTRIVTALAMLTVGLEVASAQSTVTFSAALGQPNVYFGGAAIPDHNEVRIGYFNSGFDISSHLYDLRGLDSAFKVYGTTMTTNIFNMQPGSFTGTSSQDAAGSSPFEGQKIYLWIFKTSNDGAPTADLSNVSGYGLYSSTSEAWQFPTASGAIPIGTTAINSSEINQAWFGSFDANHLYVTAVPEPSVASFALITLGMLVLAVRRKGGRK